MKSIQIKDSYKIWSPKRMYGPLFNACRKKYGGSVYNIILNRSDFSIIIEWWLHNIGYYITKPFVLYSLYLNKLNLRLRDVDLEEHLQ